MGCWDAADPAQLQPRGRRLCMHVCLCQPELHQERIPSQTYSAGKKPPSTLQVLGGGQALLRTQAELITLRASQSSPPLLSSSAEQARAPCPASAGTGQAPQPCPQPSLPRLPKKTPISSKLSPTDTYVSVSPSSWDTGAGRHRSTAASCGFVDERWCLRLALVPVWECCPQQRGHREPPPRQH